jgi:hypothetical protein
MLTELAKSVEYLHLREEPFFVFEHLQFVLWLCRSETEPDELAKGDFVVLPLSGELPIFSRANERARPARWSRGHFM